MTGRHAGARPATHARHVPGRLAQVGTLFLCLLGAGPARAQAVRQDFHITNGTVNAAALDGTTLYVGGAFSRVGPVTGSGVPLDATSGLALSDFPRVSGEVHAAVADGAGGWFIGGSFTAVGGEPRANLARILADHTVSSWDPGANATVRTLAVSGPTVYAGGDFTNAGGQPRNRIAALDAASGAATDWHPDANGTVRVLVVSGGLLYAGGAFTAVGGQARSRIAALDVGSGLATGWNPAANSQIFAILPVAGRVYVGGQFTAIGGQTRNRIAELDSAGTGVATAWNPGANGPVLALAANGGTLVAAGQFTAIAGQSRNRIAALDRTSGLVTAWNPNADNQVATVLLSGTTLYAGGDFGSIGGAPRSRIAALEAGTGLATGWDPSAYGSVLALAGGPGVIYAGGSFAGMGGLTRNNLAALDVTSGAATGWAPNPNGPVLALAVAGGVLYAGGDFTAAGGQPRNRLAALAAATGLATAWNPNADGEVSALALVPGALYVGGLFSSVGGGARAHIAQLSLSSGLATSWNPGTDGQVFALRAAPGTVWAGGIFSSAGGQPRNSIAALDAVTGLATAWNANANGTVRTLALSCNTLYAGGFFTSIGGQPRNRLAGLDATTGLATAWNPNANGPVYEMELQGGRMYVGGIFTFLGGALRSGIGALSPITGQASAWDPRATGTVRTLAVGGGTVYAGGSFTRMNDIPLSNLAAVGADGSFSCPMIAVTPSTLPAGVVGAPYTQPLAGSGGTAPHCYAVIDGSLPAGLTLNAATGHIAGTPLAAGTAVFTVGVTDASGCSGSRGYVLSIFDTPAGSTVAASTGGLCISPARPCVSVPVVYTRTEAAAARAISVTVQLDPARLALCTPGTPAASIRPGSWLAGFANTVFQVVDDGGGSYTVDQAILGLPCGVTAGGELFTMDLTSLGADGEGAITVTSLRVRDCGGAALPAQPGPAALLAIATTPPAGIADLATAQVLAGNDPGSTTGIAVTWTGGGGHRVSLYRAPFGTYPEYDDVGPVSPPDPGLAPGAPWTLAADSALSGYVDRPPVRGFWHYVALVTDACDNVSAVSNMTAGALNYHLGDVSDGMTPGVGDNTVRGVDVSLLGMHYGIVEPEIGVRGVAFLDVGPTTDSQPTSRPTTDDRLDFEDLMLFSLNYELVSAPGLAARRQRTPALTAASELEEFHVVAPSLVDAGEAVAAELRLKAAGRLQGFSARLRWDSTVVEPVTTETGGWLESQGGLVLVPRAGVVDGALLGVRGPGLAGEGLVARVAFRTLRAGAPQIRLVRVEARDTGNRRLGPEAVRVRAEAPPHGETLLLAPRPNPWRGGEPIGLEFSLGEAAPVELALFAVDGRRVRTLLREALGSGVHHVAWDGRDDRGRACGPGVYYARLVVSGRPLTRMLLRLR